MNNLLKLLALSLSTLTMAASLTACGGGGGSSSAPTTVPNSATVFYAHNVVFRNSTTVATGYNGFGQLGTGNLANRTTPGIVKGGLRFSGVATGGDHTVAFMNNSTVHSWGYNGFGQLGNNSTTFSNIPIKVLRQDVTPDSVVQLSNVLQVATGAMHSVALRGDGTVWAWGENVYGQLGVPTTGMTDKGFSRIAVQVQLAGAPLSNIVAIAANGHNSLALDSSGAVYVWGLNGSGQIGVDPATTGASAEPNKVVFPPSTVIVAIAAGGASCYAIDTNGQLWAWGNNFNGQLGDGTTTDTATPFMVPGLPPTAKVVQVAGGLQHVLVRLDDGSVRAWGYNIFGQLGNNDKKKLDQHVPVKVVANEAGDPFTGATDIRAFGSSSMAKIGTTWYAWGDNTFGQLGIGRTGNELLPVKVTGF